MAGYDKRKVVCLTVPLPIALHDRLKNFCERATIEESRPVKQTHVGILAIQTFLKSRDTSQRRRQG